MKRRSSEDETTGEATVTRPRRDARNGTLGLLFLVLSGLGIAIAEVWEPSKRELKPIEVPVTFAAPSIDQASLPVPVPAVTETPELDQVRQATQVSGNRILQDVLIRERDTQKPLVGCEVIFVDGLPDEHMRSSLLPSYGVDLELLRAKGQRRRADGEGRVSLALRPGFVFIVAVSPTHSGERVWDTAQEIRENDFDPEGASEALLLRGIRVRGRGDDREILWTADVIPPGGSPQEGPVTIDCNPSRYFTVRVTDETGTGVGGVPLSVQPTFGHSTARGRSGVDGIARLGPVGMPLPLELRRMRSGAHVDVFSQVIETPTLAGEAGWLLSTVDLFAGGRFSEAPPVEVDPAEESTLLIPLDPLPTEPIPFVIRTLGTLEVRVVDAAGRPVSCPGEVRIGRRDLPGTEQAPIDATGGAAIFERVALGSNFWVRVDYGGSHYGALAAGPVRAGERITVRVGVPSSPTWAFATLRDADGDTLRGQRIRYTAILDQDGTRFGFAGQATADLDGRVAIVMDQPRLRAASGRIFVEGERFGTVLSVARSVTVRSGRNEIGSIVLVPDVVLASGRVLDVYGGPASGAVVELASQHTPSSGYYDDLDRGIQLSRRTLRGPGATFHDWSDPAGTPLPEEWATPVMCDSAGYFTLRGWSSSPTTSIRARRSTWAVGPTVSAPKGTADVTLRL